jgi:hypothetical protein
MAPIHRRADPPQDPGSPDDPRVPRDMQRSVIVGYSPHDVIDEFCD